MYESTRGNMKGQSAAQAIAWGMVPGGGLFVPTQIPSVHWQDLTGLDYSALAQKIMGEFLPDFSSADLTGVVSIYGEAGTFYGSNPAPLVEMGDLGVLELWHGPTAAFKDMALQVLPRLLRLSLDQLQEPSRVLILVATSGDTGKAALEGFKDAPGTEIMVLYPEGGVSVVQEQQMISTGGENTYVMAVKGNFDQCQTAAKLCFASKNLKDRLAGKQRILSSANSINWGRLLPQVVYYVWLYLQAVEQKKVAAGQPVNVIVPTGNFGNILAAYYAQQMGVPLGKLICASNRNNVLSDFFVRGEYQSKRPFYMTISPSMDILISSNFERFLYEMSGRDGAKVASWYAGLAGEGSFKVDDATLKACRETVYAGWADEEETKRWMGRAYSECGYVLDPHTAVGAKVYDDYRRETGDETYTVLVSTASPFKFASSVLAGIDPGVTVEDEWEALRKLSVKTGWEIPGGLRKLEDLPTRLAGTCTPQGVEEWIIKQFAGT